MKIHPAFFQSVDFKELTKEWLAPKANDHDLKILKITNCPDFEACSNHLIADINLASQNNLFVLVMEFSENFDEPTKIELRRFWKYFNDDRPAILQLNSPDGKVKHIFVKNFKGEKFFDLSKVTAAGSSDICCLKELMENHGKFDGDIRTVKLSEIPETTEWSEIIPKSVLLMRFINLFAGSCTFLTPWLKAKSILKLNSLKTYFAFIDYPFKAQNAVQLAWDFQKYELVELFVTNHSPFPINFDVAQMGTKISENFKNILAEKEKLHQSIERGDRKGVSMILNQMEKRGGLKHAYSQSNSSAMETLLKNYNSSAMNYSRNYNLEIYEILVEKNLKFNANCWKLMTNNLSRVDRFLFTLSNSKLAKPVKRVPNKHPLMSKCFLATGHHDQDLYSKKINEHLWKLQEHPELSQLLRISEGDVCLKLIFDFKHDRTKMMYPDQCLESTGLSAYCTIYIAGRQEETEVRSTLIHEITHFVMRLIYDFRASNPYKDSDLKRKEEFAEAIAECKEVFEKKEKVDTRIINKLFLKTSIHKEREHASELIARVPEILIYHSKKESDAIKLKYPRLFAYFFKYIPSDIESYLQAEKQRKESKKAYLSRLMQLGDSNADFLKIILEDQPSTDVKMDETDQTPTSFPAPAEAQTMTTSTGLQDVLEGLRELLINFPDEALQTGVLKEAIKIVHHICLVGSNRNREQMDGVTLCDRIPNFVKSVQERIQYHINPV